MNESELQLVNKLNREMGELTERLIGIEEKIDDTHDTQMNMHNENKEVNWKILEQTTKTNGRVTKCEDFMTEQYKINSKLNGIFAKLFQDTEDEKRKKEAEKRGFWYKFFEKAIWVVVGALAYYFLKIDLKTFI